MCEGVGVGCCYMWRSSQIYYCSRDDDALVTLEDTQQVFITVHEEILAVQFDFVPGEVGK